MTVHLTHRAWCLDYDCDTTWTGPNADRDADKHTKATGHSTISKATPEEGP